MSIINKLASSSGRGDEVPNQELAKEIANNNDAAAVAELFLLSQQPDKNIQSDCIKVIYEIGGLDSKLISGHHATLVRLLDSKNNRLQWGAMTALDTIVFEKPEAIFEQLPKLLAVAEKGSVITKDHLMGILVKLYTLTPYSDGAFAVV